jgi:hypothetical protein
MPVEAVLVSSPAIDFTTLLSLTYQALGQNIGNTADASHRKMVDAEKFLSCLAVLKDRSGEITKEILSHVSFSVLVIADECDLADILDATSGMSFVHSVPTPNIGIVVVSGTLQQWHDAVASGTKETALPTVRACYSKILLLCDRAGLTSVWSDFDRRMAHDHNGFILENNQRGRTY